MTRSRSNTNRPGPAGDDGDAGRGATQAIAPRNRSDSTTACAARTTANLALLAVVAATLSQGSLPSRTAAEAIRTPASVTELFTPPGTSYAVVSPSGRFAAAIVRSADGKPGIKLVHLDSEESTEIFPERRLDSRSEVRSLAWDGPDWLIVEYAPNANDNFYEVIRLDPATKELRFERRTLRTRGKIVDASPLQPDEVLFVEASTPDSVFRVSTRRLEQYETSWKYPDPEAGKPPQRIAQITEDTIVTWLVDHEGVVRAAVAVSADPVELRFWYRDSPDARWRVIHREDRVDRFDVLVPLGFTADGDRLLVASAQKRDRYGLYEYDPATDQVGRLIFEHPTAELQSLVFDAGEREVLAVVYLQDGERRYSYLRDEGKELRAHTQRLFPGSVVETTSMSSDGRRAGLFVSRSNDPGGFYAFDLDAKRLIPIGRAYAWLDDDLLAEVSVHRVKNPEGIDLEAFLTLPPVPTTRPPVVVMPHGGPIGVADLRDYSPEVQYLARSGFAVLQVNYRGSGGLGKEFERAGHRQWGRGIEDDIDSAVDHVVALGAVDGNRMCIVGASYGGYSALMSAIRHPRRYRCAASFAGVTDIALMFNADSVYGGELLTSQLEKLVGDPDENYDEMRHHSPAYRADEIEVPIYLAHGDSDRTVDVEHMLRMRLALDLAGVPFKATLFKETGHGFSTRDDAVRYWLGLYAFLAEHLKKTPARAAGPAESHSH